MDPILHIRLLGDCCLSYGESSVVDVNTPRLQSLLAYLLLHRDAPQFRAHVAFQFWPDSAEPQAHSNLRTLLCRLRRALPSADSFLSVGAQTIQWRPASYYSLDVASFEESLAKARETDLVGEGEAAQSALEQAIELYHGDLLPSCYDDWILPERERLCQAYLSAMERLIQLLEARREYARAISYAQRLLRHDPLHETAYRRLMRLRALAGDRAGALRVYHTCATRLQRELGVDPGPATQQAYRQVLRVEDRAEPGRRASRAISPLVGRGDAWVQFLAAWRQAARRTGFLLVLGEAGIGKTRLVEEMLDWANHQGVASAYARCYAAEGELAYAPVTAMLRARPLPPLEKVWLSEVARLRPEILGEQPDLVELQPMTERWHRQRLFEALARAMLGDGQPLLLAIDDLQWCDRETLDWLHFALRFEPHHHLLVVGTCRPEELEDSPFASALPMLHRDVHLTEIELGPLGEAETASLATNVAGEMLDDALLAWLYQETEGNPLFVVEMVRAGLPAGVQASDLVGLHLPPRVQAALAARLAQLSPAAHDLVGLAATIGRAFNFTLLREAGDGDEDKLVRGLDELWQRRIVRERGADTYDFTHDKLRDGAYAALSPARRRMLHRRVAQALEVIHSPDLDPVARQVASHYRRSGLSELAVPYYLRAGEAANRIHARDDAVLSFERGLALLEGMAWGPSQSAWCQAMAAALYEGLGDALEVCHAEQAWHAYQKAVHETSQDNLLAQARLQRKIGYNWAGYGQLDRALEAYDRAETLLGAEPDQPAPDWWLEWLTVQLRRLTVYYFLGRHRDMAPLLDRVQPALERYGTTLHRGWFLANRIGLALRHDRYRVSDGTLAEARSAFAACQECKDRYWIEWSHYILGWVYLLRGNLDEAEQHLQTALALSEETGNRWIETYGLTWLSVLCRKRGRVQDVRRYASRGQCLASAVQQLEQVAMAQANQSWAALREGKLDETEQLGRAALLSWQSSRFVHAFHWTARWPLLAVALSRNEMSSALEHARAMLDPQQQQLPDPLETALESAIHACDQGQAEASRSYLEQSTELAWELGYL